MIEQLNTAVKFLAWFTASKQGVTGLTVTVDVYNPAGSLVVTAGSATALGGGLYYYTLASGSVTAEGEYVAIFKTTDSSVDAQHVPSLWVVGRAGIENLDAAASAIKAKTDNLPSSPAAVGSAMTLAANQDVRNVTGNVTGSVGSLTGYVAPDNTTITSISNRLPAALTGGGHIKADAVAISGDTGAADNLETMLDGTATGTLSLKALQIINSGGTAVTIQSTGGNGDGILVQADGSGVGLNIASSGGAGIQVGTEGPPCILLGAFGGVGTIEGNLDGDVTGSVGSLTGYVAPDNTTITAINAKTTNLPASPAATGAAMTLTAGQRVKLDASQPDYAPAKAGDAMALTDGAKNALVAAIEVELANDVTGQALMQAIADKLAAEFNLDSLTVAAIALAVRDALLDRVLAGNHTTVGSPGVLLQRLPETGTVNTETPDNEGIADILAKTNNLPAAPAAAGDIPGAATVAAAVRTELAPELARVDAAISTRNATTPPTAAAIADAVLDEALAGHAIAGSAGAALAAAGTAGDPWATTGLADYPEGSAGRIFNKLDIGGPDDPVTVIPNAPADDSLCRVYGYLEKPGNEPAAGIEITFELVAPDPIKSERLISGRKVAVKSDADGLVQVDLQRNDLLTPAGSKYLVSCPALKLSHVDLILTTETLDLATLV